MKWATYWQVVRKSIKEWQADKASRLAAALAFYTAISIAPLFMLVIVVAGFFWGTQDAVRSQLMMQARATVGTSAADFLKTVLDNADQPAMGSIAGLFGIATLIWGSTNVFTQLQQSLNEIWNVEDMPESGVWNIVKDRFLSFTMVLGIAFLLLVSLILSTVLSTITGSLGNVMPGGDWLWSFTSFMLSFLMITLLFAAIYKVLPDVEIAWSDVWIGAAVTSLLFTIGKFLLGLYLAHIGSSYGAAGSVIAFLFWVYYSSQIVFFGAEFTQVYANRFGAGFSSGTDASAHTGELQEART